MEFAFHLIEVLKGKQKADEVADMISYKRNANDVLIVKPHLEYKMKD